MSRLKMNIGRRLLACVLSGAMIMSGVASSNITAFASESLNNTGGGYYAEVAEVDEAESTTVEERADHTVEAKEESKTEANNAAGKDDVQESSDETVETTETKTSDKKLTSETKSSLREKNEDANTEESNDSDDSESLEEENIDENDNKENEETVRTEWDFTKGSDTTLYSDDIAKIEGTTGEIAGLKIDAASGKFNTNGRASNGNAQVNAVTKIKVPVTGVETEAGVKVTVKWYSASSKYTVAGQEKTSGAHEAQETECAKSMDGYIEIVLTEGNNFLELIKIEPKQVQMEVRTEWDFTKGSDTTLYSDDIAKIEGTTGEIAGLKIDAASGKFNTNGRASNGSAQVNAVTKIKVPVTGVETEAGVKVTVKWYSASSKYTVAGQEKTSGAHEAQVTECAKSTDGYIEIVLTEGNNYLELIKIEPVQVDDDPDPDDPETEISFTFDPEAEGIAVNSMETPEGSKFFKDYFEIVRGTVTGKNGTSIELKNSAESAIQFTTRGKSVIEIDAQSTNSSNTSKIVLYKVGVDEEGKSVLTPIDGVKDIVGNTNTSLSYQVEETGTYMIAVPVEGGGRGVRVAKVKVTEELTPVEVTVNVTAEGISDALKLVFACNETKKETTKPVTNGKCAVTLYKNYSYKLLASPTKYVIKEGDKLTVSASTATHSVTIEQVTLKAVTGSIIGLDTDAKAKAAVAIKLEKPESKIYTPEITIDRTNMTYSVELEADVEYAIVTEGINDYELDTAVEGNVATLKAGAADTAVTRDITYKAKPTYTVTIEPEGAELSDLSAASFTFTNLNEEDYVYTFTGTDNIKLRDGTYSVKVSNSGEFVQKLTSNLVVDGADVIKKIGFESDIQTWVFSEGEGFTADVCKSGGTSDDGKVLGNYKGLLLTGVSAETGKAHAVLKPGSEIKIPVKENCDIVVTYYYAGAASIGDVDNFFALKSGDSAYGSTTKSATATYSHTYAGNGEKEYVTLTAKVPADTAKGTSTYLNKIEIIVTSPYAETVTVNPAAAEGNNNYKTINGALDAVRQMDRTNEDGSIKRVTIVVQPGDYEEMPVFDIPNITLKNAYEGKPSITPINKGVDIDESSVRITSYYGVGYNYYSMDSNYKWNEEILKINKENGSASTVNPAGGGTASRWNATVVISADGFEADGIIFENSFNQYVSKKAAEDTIVAVGGAKGENLGARNDLPVGSTQVQYKDYVERAAALGIDNNCHQISFNNCSFISRQDTLWGGVGTTAAFYDCDIYGGTDYIMGGMTAVFAKCDLVFNTNDETEQGIKNDVGHITAAQQAAGSRGYLMYNCVVTTTTPGVNTASKGYTNAGTFGRPWSAVGEVVFYKTIIGTTFEKEKDNNGNYTTNISDRVISLIEPAGWNDGLTKDGSPNSQEYGTIELAEGVDNSDKRVTWSKVLTANEDGSVTLADGTTKITDAAAVSKFFGDWNPFEGKDMTISTTPGTEPGPGGDDTIVKKVTASPEPGTVEKNTTVSLDCETEGATIYYTIDGTDPTTASTPYTESFSLGETERTVTIKAIAVKEGMTDSEVAEFVYTVSENAPGQVSAPEANPQPGTYTKGTTITLTSSTPEAKIYYTLDGSVPTTASNSYTGSISLGETEGTVTIKAIAVKEGMTDSGVAEFVYTVLANSEDEGDTKEPDNIPPIKTDNPTAEISVRDKEITIDVANLVETKKEQYAVTVTYTVNGEKQQLTEGVHYTVALVNEGDKASDGTSVGTQWITVKGTSEGITDPSKKVKTDLGIFVGEKSVSYEIVAKTNANSAENIAKAKFALDKDDVKNAVYTGGYITPKVDNSKAGIDEKNYIVVYKNNVNVGKASVTILGKGAYYGSKTLTFSIKKTDLSKPADGTAVEISATNAKIKGSGKSYTAKPSDTKEEFDYTGSAVMFTKPVVKYGSTTLSPTSDYTITYKKNAQAGTATATIKGANNFSGAITVTYTIKVDIGNALDDYLTTGTKAFDAEYSSKGARLTSITLNGAVLKENKDYKVNYKGCEATQKEDTGTVKITGIGSYKDVIAKDTEVKIKVVEGSYHVKDGAIVDKAKLKGDPEKDKTTIISTAKITDASGAKVKPEDITITFNENDCTKITVTPKDTTNTNYKAGDLDCRIATKLSSVKPTDKKAKIADKPFDGVYAVTLTETDIVNAKVLSDDVKAKDIRIVSYKNNNKIGSATVTIEGRATSAFYGTKSLKFKIVATKPELGKDGKYKPDAEENPETPPTGTDPGPDDPGTDPDPGTNPGGGDDPSTGDEPATDSEEATHTIWLVGDSTVCSYIKEDGTHEDGVTYYPRDGYGTQVSNYETGYYTVKNLALSGRSSKSFLSESNYTTLTEGISEGDVLIIGFGHNDEKDEEARYTNPNGTYETEGSFAKSLYDNYVKIAQDKGAQPILCTPIVRRDKTSDTLSNSECHITSDKTTGGVLYPGGDYAQAIRDLGTAVNVPVVDLTALTKELYERIGKDETRYLHKWSSSKETSVDDTHLNTYGAKVVAHLLATELRKTNTEIAKHITNIKNAPTKEKDLVVNPDYVEKPYTAPTTDSTLWAKYGIFKGSIFGDLGGTPSTANFTLEADADNNMHIKATGKGKIADGSDGIAMYYYQIPADKPFTLSAKAKINEIDSNSQVAFGLMARDDMYIDKNESVASDYVVAGTFGKASTNCFYRRGSSLGGKSSKLDADVQAGETYNLAISFNGDGYTCTFGDNAVQSGGYDFTLKSVDAEYQYIGMFVARKADITFSDIKLTVDGQEVDIMQQN